MAIEVKIIFTKLHFLKRFIYYSTDNSLSYIYVYVFTVIIYFADAANNLTSPTLVQYSEFYNPTLDHLDLMAEYYTWQNPSSCAGYLTTSVPPPPHPTPERNQLHKNCVV